MNISSKKKIAYKVPKSAIVWIQSTRNNTLLTLTDAQGSTLAWSSGGTCGFKNSRKSTTHAAENAAVNLSEKIYAKGFNSIAVKTKGYGRGKKRIISAFSRCGLFIESLTEIYNIPFNGCRPLRKRRL